MPSSDAVNALRDEIKDLKSELKELEQRFGEEERQGLIHRSKFVVYGSIVIIILGSLVALAFAVIEGEITERPAIMEQE